MMIVESVVLKMFVFATCVLVFTACATNGGNAYQGTTRRPQTVGYERP